VNGTAYYYVISAVNSAGESTNSGQAIVTPIAPPPAPANLLALPGDSIVSLSWNAVPGALSYHLKRSFTNGGPYIVIANLASTTYTNAGLLNGTTYYYVVSAVNSVGEGPDSSQAFATPACPVQPAPSNLSATMINSQIALRWNAAAGASNYTVFHATTPTGSYTALATNLTGTNFTDVASGISAVSYYFVRATSSCGAIADSSAASAPLRVTNWTVNGFQSIMSGGGGVAGQTFYILASTNITASVSQWPAIGTNFFGPGGSFSFTNTIDPTVPRQFYLIQAPSP
jgi:cellulose 1,4-beta-cellobiosidase